MSVVNCPVCFNERTVISFDCSVPEAKHGVCTECYCRLLETSNACPQCRKTISVTKDEEFLSFVSAITELHRLRELDSQKEILIARLSNLEKLVDYVTTGVNKRFIRIAEEKKGLVERMNHLKVENTRLKRTLLGIKGQTHGKNLKARLINRKLRMLWRKNSHSDENKRLF